jgi:hypothetical protein
MKTTKLNPSRNGSGDTVHSGLHDLLADNLARAGEGLRHLGEQIGTSASEAYEKSLRAGEKLHRYASDNPGKTFMVALAAGYIVARMVHRAPTPR